MRTVLRTLVGVCSVVVGSAFFTYLLIEKPTWLQLVSALGWLVFVASVVTYNALMDKKEVDLFNSKIAHLAERGMLLGKMQHFLEQMHGYREDMARDAKVYPQLLEKGVGLPFANAVTEFVQEVEPTDTVFMIRIDNRDRQWYFNIAGLPVYESTAKWLFDTLSERCESWSGSCGMVVKDRKKEN